MHFIIMEISPRKSENVVENSFLALLKSEIVKFGSEKLPSGEISTWN